MIYYIAMRDKLEKESVKRIIKEFDKNPKIYDANKVFEEEEKILKKTDIIISDNDKSKIKKYNQLKKQLIVYIPKSKTPKELLKNKNCYTYSKKNELREILCFSNKRRKIWKKIAISSLIIIMIGCIISCSLVYYFSVKEKEKKEQEQIETKKKMEEEKRTIEEKDKIKKENIIFLGDSITEGYDLEKYYPDMPVINSGVSGYCTDDIIKNLKEFVYIYNPTKVVLLIGTNDIRFKDYGNTGIVNNIKTIIKEIRKNRPYATIYVESIYPINKVAKDNKINLEMIANRENNTIIEINELIKELCDKEDVEYIDLHKELVDEEGNFKINYTRDGLHVSEEGYEIITKKIKDTLEIN